MTSSPFYELNERNFEMTNTAIAKMMDIAFRDADVPFCKVKHCEVEIVDRRGRMSDDPASESYSITFDDASGCLVSAATVFGMLRALQTTIQALDPLTGLRLPKSFVIVDKPQFAYRGLLVDTSRHFIPVPLLQQIIAAMSSVKLNVFHWHIVDHHSFPMESLRYPLLSGKGAYHPTAIYSQEDIRSVVMGAALMGIRVIPEIDIPGHTQSWFKGYPELQVEDRATIDPTKEESYVFIRNLLEEVRDLFKSNIYDGLPTIHLGGDETDNGWDAPAVVAWMHDHGMTTKAELVRYWVSRIMDIAHELSIKVIMWEDFLNDTKDDISGFSDETNPIIWQTWLRRFGLTADLSANLNRSVIFSSDFYLDHLENSWDAFYNVNMTVPVADAHVLGGTACMWSEWVDETNIFQRIWPRAAAVAERLWCGDNCDLNSSKDAVIRLAKWRCRAKYFNGFENVEPVGTVYADAPENVWASHTDKEQWWCAEADLFDVTSLQPESLPVIAQM